VSDAGGELPDRGHLLGLMSCPSRRLRSEMSTQMSCT
jgi:hypothetical protein